MRALLTSTVALLALASCSRPPTSTPGETGALSPVTLPGGHPTLTPLPDPEANGGHAGRAPRRISVDQLRQSILVATGQEWVSTPTVPGLKQREASLGKADFAATVSDATEPNLVFSKFLEDGARVVCKQVSTADKARPQAQRVLWPEVAGTVTDFTTLDDATIQRNLSTLAVRFWGSPFDAPELEAWTASFRRFAAGAKAANAPEQAWGAVCVAMMTDPRFITY